MAYIDRDNLIKDIEKLYPGYDEYGMRYLMRSQVLRVIKEQPGIEMQKCCATCLCWDKERNSNNRCFCEYLEANTPSDFCCTFWEEDKEYGRTPQV